MFLVKGDEGAGLSELGVGLSKDINVLRRRYTNLFISEIRIMTRIQICIWIPLFIHVCRPF